MSKPTKDVTIEEITQNTEELFFDDEKNPISKKAYKKLQKDKEKAERKSATATKLAAEKAERESKVLPLKLGRLRILNPSLQQSALQLNYSSKQRLPFVYYNRVQLYNASNSGRLADRIAERTAQK
ncbi:hypothetical protein G6F51_005486 [Rhizopus arrhizus]|uniref:Uncharacterized protein n=1 Tax=Rhizopus oryzae TaxID=64495 RepID=A0A9P7CC34_RHIOR|nr:hypothetical protein G6F51_005486 [Rhizopus arrhizus]